MPAIAGARCVLVLGGARSGKSRFAEAHVLAGGGRPIYLATATVGDDAEMAARIAHHRARRGDAWSTVEEPLELTATLHRLAQPGAAVLVDCLTLWLTNVMLAGRDIPAETAALAAALPELPGRVVLVANEVGLGIVPDNAMARAFRDLAGRLNQAVAATADAVVFLAAGLPLVLKACP
ncbi:MAG: bifunctional adenosylcobinamide kinase/adenosylcobinamide-phosphate guanylyltransferase [Rhodospirillaceae bacterium]|nr:bifunctional adenosylcobinamide kinase/adenosylcobinamide-phosphate guanylyltransferase [Rhodospirillaceae bacterium]